eukprot:SM000126S26313  [mRNA]  locus=s126:138246:138296:- [translate_table: standard]
MQPARCLAWELRRCWS